ncbi:hypothetical protein REPUB_Repub03eG0122400 [Reevesia pubescens]
MLHVLFFSLFVISLFRISISMATSDDFLRDDPRLCFFHNSNRQGLGPSSFPYKHLCMVFLVALIRPVNINSIYIQKYYGSRKKVIDGNPGVSCPGNNLLSDASSSGHSGEPQTLPTGNIQVKSRTGHAKQYQSNKIKMNKDSAPAVKKSENNATPVSRLSKQKEQTTQSPKDPATSLLKRSGTSTILESKQLTLTETTQPLKDPAGLAKKKTIQSPKNSTKLVENGATSTNLAPKHVRQKKETTQPPKDPAGLIKNIGTRRILASIHSMQKKKTTQSPKDSGAWVKKSDTATRIPTSTQSTRKKENNQPFKGSAGLVSKHGTGTVLPSKVVTHKKETIPAKPRQEQHICQDHVVWEGFDKRIVPLESNCLLCDGDLANEPEYDADIDRLNPAENAVLSCGHVFHSLCLLYATSEEKSRDPPCIICYSILS